ncbi:hypothetical protein [Paraburkholderia sp. J94]|uniref:hypothetical protein n=1 Tax=Paraburkholderia sp. J94 TaxID=2805441 RepID=UPI002AB2E196|nr:hypothetical protein [Paraburkholderia sp. J94]
MEIDLREIQALHARYAREPVVIDLEAQLRARPAPLLLAHDPSVAPSPLRRAWQARASVGRGALMVVGGTFLCGAIGMGAAKLYGSISHPALATSHAAADATPAPAAPRTSEASASANSSAAPLTADDFNHGGRPGAALAAVDPASLMRQQPSGAPVAPGPIAAPTVADSYAARAAASPIRQGRTQQLEVQAAPAAAGQSSPLTTRAPSPASQQPQTTAQVAPAAPPATNQPEVTPTAPAAHAIHHAPRRHASAAREAQPTAADTKAADANPVETKPAGRGGDVQLF